MFVPIIGFIVVFAQSCKTANERKALFLSNSSVKNKRPGRIAFSLRECATFIDFLCVVLSIKMHLLNFPSLVNFFDYTHTLIGAQSAAAAAAAQERAEKERERERMQE